MKVTKKKPGYSRGTRGAVALAILLLGLADTMAWAQERDLSEARVSFALGQRAFGNGDFEEAARHFEEAAGSDPGNGDSLHWLALTFLRLGRPAEAVGRLEQSLNVKEQPSAGSKRVRSDLRLAREAVEKGSSSPVPVEPPAYNPDIPLFEDLPRWEGRAGLKALYDSNPGLLPEDLLFPLPGRPSFQGASADEAAALDAGIEHHPFYSRGWSLGLALEGQHSMYQDQGDLDLSVLRGTVSLARGGSRTGSVSGPLGSTRVPTTYNRISVLLQGGGAGIWLDGDAYLELAEAALSLTARRSSRTATRIDVEVRSSSYEDDASGVLRRGGTESLAGASQSLYFGRDDRYLRLGLIVGERRAGRAFDSSSGEILAEVAAPFSDRWSLSALGSWREDRFNHPESRLATVGQEREDATWRWTLAGAFRMSDQVRWTVRGSHVRRDSNVRIGLGTPLFDYERTTFSLGFDWRP